MKSRSVFGWKILAPLMLLLLACCSVCEGCPTCRYAIAESTAQAGIIQGYFWSILFMMSMPFLILGGLSAYFYYQVRQARGMRNQVAPANLDEATPSVRSS